MTTTEVFENTQELINQMLGNNKQGFSYNIYNKEHLNLQLGYDLLEISEGVMGSLSSERCLYCVQDFAGRVFDRGRLVELIQRSTEFCLYSLAPCMFVLNGLKLIVGYSGNVFPIVTSDGSLKVCEFVHEIAQQVDIL